MKEDDPTRMEKKELGGKCPSCLRIGIDEDGDCRLCGPAKCPQCKKKNFKIEVFPSALSRTCPDCAFHDEIPRAPAPPPPEISQFYDGERFLCPRFAEFLIREKFGGHVRTEVGTDMIFIWDETEKLWAKNGEEKLRAAAYQILGEEEFSLRRISETLGAVRASTYIFEENPEPPARYIPLQNGIFDIETGVLEEYRPEFFFTFRVPVVYDLAAQCPTIEKFFSEVTPREDITTLYEITGMCLWRGPEFQQAVMLFGSGGNGKSTYISLLKHFLGVKNVSARSLQELEDNRFAMAGLRGKLANLFADLPSKGLRGTSAFKALTGGDFQTAERKYGRDPVEFVNTAKLLFSANRLPETSDETDAFFRRWHIIAFPYSFIDGKNDPDLLAKLTTPQELSGLMNKAISNLKNILVRKRLTATKALEDVRKIYLKHSSSVACFMDSELEYDPQAWTQKELLFRAYLNFCATEKMLPVPETKFWLTFMLRAGFRVDTKTRRTDPQTGKNLYVCAGVSLKGTEKSTVGLEKWE